MPTTLRGLQVKALLQTAIWLPTFSGLEGQCLAVGKVDAYYSAAAGLVWQTDVDVGPIYWPRLLMLWPVSCDITPIWVSGGYRWLPTVIVQKFSRNPKL